MSEKNSEGNVQGFKFEDWTDGDSGMNISAAVHFTDGSSVSIEELCKDGPVTIGNTVLSVGGKVFKSQGGAKMDCGYSQVVVPMEALHAADFRLACEPEFASFVEIDREFSPQPLPADATPEEVEAEKIAEIKFFEAPDFSATYVTPDAHRMTVKVRDKMMLHLIDGQPVAEDQFRDMLVAIPGDSWAFEVEDSGKEFILRRPNEKAIMRSNAKILQQRANFAKMQELAAWNAAIDAKKKEKKDAKRGIAMPEMAK